MKIDFRETTDDLQKRIDIHSQYGSRDIDEWMLDILNLQPGMKILDVGCGAGKQCLSYYGHLGGNVQITGGDVSQELLNKARETAAGHNASIRFIDLDFNKRFPLNEASFDFESCCFAIYYAEDIPFTIAEMHRVLRPGGRLFTSGPMPQNKQLFYEIIREATGKEIPPMPGSSRYSTSIHDEIARRFSSIKVHIFENPLTFSDAEPFVAYTRASLSEDRKLWNSFFQSPTDFETIISKIAAAAKQRLAREGKLVMTKVVGGFVATK